MAVLYTHLLLLFCVFTTFGSCHSFRRRTSDHEFPVLRLDRRVPTVPGNQTKSNNTIAESWACKFTNDYLFQAVKTNCSAYIEPLELTTSFQPWERYETVNSFANCTYHQIATRFPDIPDGVPLLVFRDGSLIFRPNPNMADARIYAPRPPIEPQVADQVKAASFLPILTDATEPFFRLVASDTSKICAHRDGGVNSTNTTAADINSVYSPGSMSTLDISYLLQSIEIATHQYTRCAIQQPSSIQPCTVSTVSKLGQLPSPLFIYFGSPQCDSKLWSFVGVGLSILLEFLHIAALMFLRQSTDTRSFSWLQFLIKLVSGIGEPAIQAVLLQKANGDTASGFVLAAMELLQPTAAPLLAAVSGWWFSKGHGFQVLATDALTTLLGLVMITAFTSLQIAFSMVHVSQGMSLLVLIGLICAVGPWVLTYLLIGCVSLPMQLGFIFGMFETWISDGESNYGFTVFFMGLGVLLVVVGFVAATPLFAIWEAIWVAIQQKRKWKGQTEKSETGEKPLFPLARWFHRKFHNTSRWKRGLVKFVFWLFILMSFASFVGKWMFMVNLLTFAGDAYCPSGYKDATFAGLGFKAGILSFSIVLQFFGLTA